MRAQVYGPAYSTGPVVIDGTGLGLEKTIGAIGPDQLNNPVGKEIAKINEWVNSVRPKPRYGGRADRDQYLSPGTTMGNIMMSRKALGDDVVGSAADSSEFLAISGSAIFTHADDEQEIWDKWVEQSGFNNFLRSAWRTLFTDSQFVASSWWETVQLELEDKVVEIEAPKKLAVLDSTKVVPVGMDLFDNTRLAYVATYNETTAFQNVLSGKEQDPLVEYLIEARYFPDSSEQSVLSAAGVKDLGNLFLIKPGAAWRHTLTRAGGQRFADVRLSAVFELLDLKAQLHQSDRAALVGAANYIVLITQGSKEQPLLPAEYQGLQQAAQTIGQQPFLVGDHRLSVEILTPKVSEVLDIKRYDNMDIRIFTSVFNTFVHPTSNRSNDDAKTGTLVAKGLQGRREQMKQSLEENVLRSIKERNPHVFSKDGKLEFSPSDVSVYFDASKATLIYDAHQTGSVSRSTMLNAIGLNEDDEAVRITREREKYPDVFVPPLTDPSDPATERRRGGRSGGLHNGGGRGRPGEGHGEPPVEEPAEVASLQWLEGHSRDELIVLAGDYDVKGRHQMKRDDLIVEILEAMEADVNV